MAILNILEFPDPRLRTIAKPVAVVDDEVRQLVDDMFETMYEAPGIDQLTHFVVHYSHRLGDSAQTRVREFEDV